MLIARESIEAMVRDAGDDTPAPYPFGPRARRNLSGLSFGAAWASPRGAKRAFVYRRLVCGRVRIITVAFHMGSVRVLVG